MLFEDFSKKGIKNNESHSRNLVVEFKLSSLGHSKNSVVSQKQTVEKLPNLALRPSSKNHVVEVVEEKVDLKTSAITANSLFNSTLSNKAPKLFSTLQHSHIEEESLIPTSRFKYIISNIPDEFMKPRKSKRKNPPAVLLTTNDKVTLNLAQCGEAQVNSQLPPRSTSHAGQQRNTHSTFPAKKRSKNMNHSQKNSTKQSFEMGCIESRKIVYPDKRNWIGQNLNNELIY